MVLPLEFTDKSITLYVPISVFLFRFKRAYVIVSMRYEGKQETEENKKKKGGNKRAARGNGKEVEKEKEERLATSQSLEGAVEAALPGKKEKKYGTEINAPSNLDPSSLRINGNERNGSRKSFFLSTS